MHSTQYVKCKVKFTYSTKKNNTYISSNVVLTFVRKENQNVIKMVTLNNIKIFALLIPLNG